MFIKIWQLKIKGTEIRLQSTNLKQPGKKKKVLFNLEKERL